MQNNELLLTSMCHMVLEISSSKVSNLTNLSNLTSPFYTFLVSFSIKYDVTDAIPQDIEKMKVQYFRSVLFDLFEILQAVRSKQRNLA